MDDDLSAAERARALGQAVNGRPEQVSAVLPELAALLASTWTGGDDEGLWEVVSALGLASDPRAAALLLPLARAGHHDPQVRQCLAWALCTGVDTDALRHQVIEVLVVMSSDHEVPVRDWACCALGLNEADDASSCDALAARLDDVDLDTRCEALLALANAGDPRALPAVLAALDEEDGVPLLVLEAASALAHPALLPPLQRLARAWNGDEDEHCARLALALPRCASEAAVAAQRIETAIAHAARQRSASGAPSLQLAGSWPHTKIEQLEPDGTRVEDEVPRRLWDVWETPSLADLDRLVLDLLTDPGAPPR